MDLLLQAAECSDGAASVCSAGNVSTSADSTASSTAADYKTILYSNFISAQESYRQQQPPPKSMSRSNSGASLPPKKRMRFCSFMSEPRRSDASLSSLGVSVVTASSRASGYTDSPTLNSEWTEATVAEMRSRKDEVNLLQLCNTVIVPTKRRVTQDKNDGSKPRRVSLSFQKTPSPELIRPQVPAGSSSVNNEGKNVKTSLVKDVNGNDMCMGYFSMTSHKSADIEGQAKPQDMNKMNKSSVDVKHTNQAASSTTAKSLLYQAYLQALEQQPHQ